MGFTFGLLPILIGAGAAAVGTSVYEAISAPAAPSAPTSTETVTQQAQASQAAALAQAQALTKRRGMAATILTSPMGASTPPTVGRATLGA
jgi:hypothetical protein